MGTMTTRTKATLKQDNERVAVMAAELNKLRGEKKLIEAKEEELKWKLAAEFSFRDYSLDFHHLFGEYRVTEEARDRRTITREALLEQGVDPVKIGNATKVSSFTVWTVKLQEQNGGE